MADRDASFRSQIAKLPSFFLETLITFIRSQTNRQTLGQGQGFALKGIGAQVYSALSEIFLNDLGSWLISFFQTRTSQTNVRRSHAKNRLNR